MRSNQLGLAFVVLCLVTLQGCDEEETTSCSPVGYRSCMGDILTTCEGDASASSGTPVDTDCTADGLLTCKLSFTDRDPDAAGCVPEACQDPCFKSEGTQICFWTGESIKVCGAGVDANGNPVAGCLSWVDVEVCAGGTTCSEAGGAPQCM